MKLSKFIEEYCNGCGSQRCDPKDPDLREGCKYWQELKEKETDQVLKTGC